VRLKLTYRRVLAGAPAGRRDCLGTRDVLAGGGMLGKIAGGITEVTGDGMAPARRNARHTAGLLRDLAALRAFAAGRRGAVSRMRISDGRGREAPNAMVIRKGKRRKGRGSEGPHIAFATNMPPAGPDEPCPRRWGTGNCHKMPRQTRMRTSGRDENVRIFCFVVLLMVHNAWTMLHPGRRVACDSRRIPAASLKTTVLLEACAELGVQPRLRPPRRTPHQAAPRFPHLGSVGLGRMSWRSGSGAQRPAAPATPHGQARPCLSPVPGARRLAMKG